MGKAADLQTSYLLGLIHSSFITLDEENLVEELKPTIIYGRERSSQILDIYPVKYQETKEWWQPIIDKVNAIVNSSMESFTPRMIVAFGVLICTDLLDELTCPEKRALVKEMEETLQAIDDFLDPEGSETYDYDTINRIMDEVYSVIGFVRERRYWKRKEKLAKRATRGKNEESRLSEEKAQIHIPV